ncbi:phage tail sheath subtilisin-like domain-containing protein [Caballeronia sp. SEWSISQ10-4 2]|uniref:phage tail sheath family protein n=1 Tax=Caballeronia sp. SEWSISQ10-4 2 TaxID=2937438 RepID=UPI00264A83D4|nr:phage tail sheath C-terminal domain-containing protein [Caballeronia sp. SEWSISQ10-4 2]MDN7179618.1 phage tail sheath subtilisin-like domain-containing protein [Caballeronia sp. SEWSISQ10-4 2]
MPVTLTYPGVYIEEAPSVVHTITGVSTSIAAFVGQTAKGAANDPTTVFSFGDFEQAFGGLSAGKTLGFAVRDFFLNGGSQAIIVRVTGTVPPPPAPPAAPAAPAAPAPAPAPAVKLPGPATASLKANDLTSLQLQAASPGAWGNALTAIVDYKTAPAGDQRLTFNLTIIENGSNGSKVNIEKFLNLSVDPRSNFFVAKVLANQSALVRLSPDQKMPVLGDDGLPNPLPVPPEATTNLSGGEEGPPPRPEDIQGDQASKTGLFALEKADIFNMLCIPPPTPGSTLPTAVVTAAVGYCETRRAIMIVDPPTTWIDAKSAVAGATDLQASIGAVSKNAAVFFPRIIQANPVANGQMQEFVPCGAVAGVFARTDAQRGVWKAPAGIDATLINVPQLSVSLHDGESGQLNPLGVNCLRAFPIVGRVIWGSRTTRGADVLADQYKYIPVRRLALFLEESLYRGTQWVVFEPNDEPLWSQIRLNVGAFMQNLFRQGAFQGQTPKDAYFVKCDKETTTQNDIDLGIVNVVVGFAPLKPAEFVVITLQQIAGQIQV